MKYLYYLGGICLAGLMLVLWPHAQITDSALAAEAAPTISQWQPSQIPSQEFSGGHLLIIGSSWPVEMYGLTAVLHNRDLDQFISMETVSYTPAIGRMLVRVPWHVTSDYGQRYDLILMTRNGTRTTMPDAITVTGEATTETVSEPGPDEDSGAVDSAPDRPPVDIVLDTDAAPVVTAHNPEVINTAVTGPMLVLTGQNWPHTTHGLSVYLRQSNTDKVFYATTISYTPEVGRLVVELPYLPQTPNTAYDIIVSTINGARTTIKNGLWVTDGS
jgi:hypothetical protein